MDFLTGIYLGYTFITFYFLFLLILIFIQNRKFLYEAPEIKKEFSLSIVVPCFNAEEVIESTIENLVKSDYKGLKKIIVVDDCSTDNSYDVIKKCAGKYENVLAVQTPKNTGNAAGAKNYGAKFVDTELIGFTDDDSSPKDDAISKMIGFFNDENVAAVTSKVLVKRRNNILEKIQAVEYKIIAFTRKLLNFVDGIYVTNGPLSIYKKNAFDKVGGFDVKNLTEDIEITWHFVAEGYKVCMGLSATVYTFVPNNLKAWFKQRIRWNVGGVQTIMKYKSAFLRRGMLGKFILPFFVFGWLLGIFGLIVLAYRLFTRLIFQYFSTAYSVEAQVALITFRDISLTPNIMVFFGIFTLFLSLFFTFISLIHILEKDFKRDSLFTLFVYMFFYLLAYPIILITSFVKYSRGYNKWGR
jgi:biofilm PGA synthesis N-glycosyltransferase PgaC